MSTVTLTSGEAFAVQPDESILTAALKAGVLLEHSCRTGRCSACRSKVVQGETFVVQAELGLTVDDKAEGWVLSCCRSITQDLILDQRALSRALPAERIIPAKVQVLEPLTPDLLKIRLRLPPRASFEFVPGQYVDIASPQGTKRSYSVSSSPNDTAGIEFLIRRVAGGKMSQYWFDQARPDDLVRIHGPKGTFFIRDTEAADLIFLATGTGIAPVQSMVMALQNADRSVPRVTVLWGNRHRSDFIANPSDWLPGLRYIPVLSQPDDTWAGARGHLQAHFDSCSISWDHAHVYACGSPAMIEDSRVALLSRGLPDHRFFADAFVCSA
jgi:CDP-4-dehydro-6-deoxyglucose reductase